MRCFLIVLIQIEVVATKSASKMSDRQLFETALDWIRRTVKCGKKLEELQQEVDMDSLLFVT